MQTIKTVQPRQRMSAAERRADILQAVIPVFAVKGFAATTTKDLAKAANVSEALLYRHFPSKESLYEEIQEQICATQSSIHEYVDSLKPGSEGLVKLIYLIFKIIYESKDQKVLGNAIHRLMIQSMLEDGTFTKSFNEPRFEKMLPVLAECVAAARKEGEIEGSLLTDNERLWFPHHLAMSLRLACLPVQPVYEYQASSAEQLLHAAWFSLRGIGLSDEVIGRTLNPADLDPAIDEVLIAAGLR